MPRPTTRRVLSRALLVLAAVLLPVGLIAGWANSTLYDSQSFSRRSVDLLDDPTVRRELAARLTEQLARSGNRQAVNFRPAFQLAVEAVIDTDTFHSIFRTAVFQVHQALLSDDPDSASLDLSDSVDIIVSNLQLPTDAKTGQSFNGSLGDSLSDTTHRLAKLHVWQLDAIAGGLTIVGLGGALVLGGLSIAVADDRRRATRRVGIGVVVGGLVVLVAVQVAVVLVGRAIADTQLSAAVQAGLGRAMTDLVTTGLWVAGYGVVLAAAASTRPGHRFSPAAATAAVQAWLQRRRATTGGTVVLGVGLLLAGLLLIADPLFWLRAVVVGLALTLTYAGVAELLSLVHRVAQPTDAPAARHRRTALIGAAVVALTALMIAGLLVTTRQAATRAEAAGTPECNGASSLCDLPLTAAMFTGSHNSMSSALYPGFLFAEQIGTIRNQLDAGIRALFIDTHYGVPSSARLPGSDLPLILTDRAAELTAPPGSDVDPAITARAAQLSAQAPPAAGAQRGIYLCHNSCELGAVPFSSALGEVRSFLDANPDEVVMLMIQDATTPADTAAAIEAAGLAERAYTLQPGRPVPTLGELIRSRHDLLVFAEGGGPGAPDWYQKGYDWFQETPFTFANADAFSCGPNRGPADAPLFLVNHWVSASPPDPDAAARVNTTEVLSARLKACLQQRDQLPNVIAVDFAERSAVVSTVAALNQTLVHQVRTINETLGAGSAGSGDTTAPGSSTGDTTGSSIPGDTDVASVLLAPTPITSLTGGDPQRFCATLDPALGAISAWVLAVMGAPTGATARPDLTFAPLVSRVLPPVLASAPIEIEARLAPARDRVAQALAALGALGGEPDAPAIDQQLTDQIVAAVGSGPFDAAVRNFAAQHPRPADLFDLGDVSPTVATDAGWGCLAS